MEAADDDVLEGARRGDVEAVAAALARGGSATAVDSEGLTALHLGASCAGDAEQAVALVAALVSSGASLSARSQKGGLTPLRMAAESGHAGYMRALLEAGADANAREGGEGDDRHASLHAAATFGHVACVAALLEADADVDATASNAQAELTRVFAEACLEGDERKVEEAVAAKEAREPHWSDGFTALIAAVSNAVSNEHVACVEALIAGNADVNKERRDGVTALILAAEKGHDTILRALLEAGADPSAAKHANGATALIFAAENGHAAAVEALLAAGADANATISAGTSALQLAAKGGHGAVVKVLVAGGGDVAHSTPDGLTALSYAAFKDSDESEAIVETLRSAGADVNAVSGEGESDLMMAAGLGNTRTLKALLAAGADMTLARSDDGAAALQLAVQTGHGEGVGALLAAGADANAADPNGVTPLMFAAVNGHAAIIDALVAAGGDATTALASGDTALSLAAKEDNVAVIKSLLVAGADPNAAQTVSGLAPLHLAAYLGHEANVSELVAGGADVWAADKDGDSALAMASAPGHDAAAGALLAAYRRPPNGVFGQLERRAGCSGRKSRRGGSLPLRSEAKCGSAGRMRRTAGRTEAAASSWRVAQKATSST